MSGGFEIINPVAQVPLGNEGEGVSLKRVDGVEGLRVGLLDNGMPHADNFLHHIGHTFEERYKTSLLMRRKPYTARSAGNELLDEIAANCDVAITGFGV
jgi:hypothetical protein